MLLVPVFQFVPPKTAAASSTSVDSTTSFVSSELEGAVVDLFQVDDPSSIRFYSINQVVLEGLHTGQPAAEQQGASSSSSSSDETRNPAMLGVSVKEYDITLSYIEKCRTEKHELEMEAIRADLNLSMAQGDLHRCSLRLAEKEAELEMMKAACEQLR
jgi:hypothetical protein